MPQEFVSPPVFCQLDGRAAYVAVILLQFGFKSAEKGECISCGTGESGKNLVLI